MGSFEESKKGISKNLSTMYAFQKFKIFIQI